jgi:PAS domain S-box-containing protein
MVEGGNGQHELKPREVSSEALVEAIIDLSDDAIFTCAPGGRITTWSATAERLFGRLAADVLEGSAGTLFPEHLRAEVQAVMETVLAGDCITHYETELQRPDGMPLPVSLSLRPVFDADDLPVGTVVLVRDVTEQRLAQATLAELDARLEEGEALAHVGSWLWDLRTGSMQWSTEYYRIHGVDPLDFDGTFDSHVGMIHSEDRMRVRHAMEHSVVSGQPFESEHRVVRPDGEVRVVRVRAQPTFGSAGTPVGLRGIGQDATEPAQMGVSPSRPDS